MLLIINLIKVFIGLLYILKNSDSKEGIMLKKIRTYALLSMFILLLWTFLSHHEAEQEALAHTGAGRFEISGSQIIFDKHGMYWKIKVRDITEPKQPSSYTTYINVFTYRIRD